MFYSLMKENGGCDSATFGAAHHSFEVVTLNAIAGCIYGIYIRHEYRFTQWALNILFSRYIVCCKLFLKIYYIISNTENKLRTFVLYSN